MTAALPVLIAGGGIGGLATAIGLARRGIPTKVLERRVQFSEAGAGIQIGPNGVRALRHLGIDGLVQPYVATPRELIVHAGRSGRVLARLPLGDWIEARHGAPYWAVHRADLQTALLARLAREPLVEIVPAFDVGRFEIASGAVHVQDPHGRTASGGALIGADGQFSQIRQQLPDAPALRLSDRKSTRLNSSHNA